MNSMPFGWNPRFSGEMSEATLRGIRVDPFAFTFLDRHVLLLPIVEALFALRTDVTEWQMQVGKLGIQLGTEFSDTYMPISMGGAVPLGAIRSRDHLVDDFRALGVDDQVDLVDGISAFIADRGASWTVEQRAQEGIMAVTVTFPIEQFNYTAHHPSIEIALGSATLYLLKQIETEQQRPATLRVKEDGDWSVH